MLNMNHLLKVTAIWVSVVYTVCYAGVAIFQPIRGQFMRYAMHADVPLQSGYFSFGYFVAGLIIWNVVALLGMALFVAVYNRTK